MGWPKTELNAEDLFNNELNLINFSNYLIGERFIKFYMHSGQTMRLNYNTQDKCKEIYDKILKIEKQYKEYTEYINGILDDIGA